MEKAYLKDKFTKAHYPTKGMNRIYLPESITDAFSIYIETSEWHALVLKTSNRPKVAANALKRVLNAYNGIDGGEEVTDLKKTLTLFEHGEAPGEVKHPGPLKDDIDASFMFVCPGPAEKQVLQVSQTTAKIIF